MNFDIFSYITRRAICIVIALGDGSRGVGSLNARGAYASIHIISAGRNDCSLEAHMDFK